MEQKKEKDLIKACRAGNRTAQKQLFESYSGLFMSIIRRYIKRNDVAEDVLMKGFVKIFKSLHQFGERGSFEGWMKRIIVNESLMEIRSKSPNYIDIADVQFQLKDTQESVEENLGYRELLALLDELPVGYRTVLNMYEIEGYKHREIAEILGISINTSKSQLIHAKKKFRELLKKNNINHDQKYAS